MSEEGTIGSLFVEEPAQWGLRGDPHLWRAMRVDFDETPLPRSEEALRELLSQRYETHTGQPIAVDDNVFVERFSSGGMSSGVVSARFWQEVAVPLLCERYLLRRSTSMVR